MDTRTTEHNYSISTYMFQRQGIDPLLQKYKVIVVKQNHLSLATVRC